MGDSRIGGLTVWRSNRVERLVRALADRLSVPIADPFAAETVVIPSRGMESWLSARLAERLEVCAGVDFPFPNALLHRAFTAALGDDVRSLERWEPDRLTFSVLAALRGLLGHRAFSEIRRYVEGDPNLESPRALRFARRVAELFDRYHAYRPELCRRWSAEQPQGEGWSPILWNALRERLGGVDPSEVSARFLERCETPDLPLPGFPSRVFVFGVSMLPPLHVRLFGALARHVEVDLFVPTPSREFWGHVRTVREARRDERRAAARGVDPALLALDDGHPLLAAFGRLGRDFQEALEGESYQDGEGVDLFEDPGGASSLRALQSDLLALRPSAAGHVDESVALHACHGPMRQVEVLHDRILSLFRELPELEARDVLCMTPDLDTFAPLVEAVFGTERAGQERIPFRIADRTVRRESAVADAFLRLAELAGARQTATEVFDVLSLPVVRGRFGLDAEALDRVAGWIRDSGVRWGRDAHHRASEGQPETDQNTWRFGLDRLLLGVAMRGDGERTFAGVLPVDDVEGIETAALGGLAAFVAALAERTSDLEQGPRPLRSWIDAFQKLLELIRSDDENAWEHEAVRDALLELAVESEEAGFDGTFDLAAARELVAGRLERASGSAVFATGGVTFCEMVPMRSVPHAVVCLLGLDDGVFPRSRTAASFDLIASHPQAGDRNPRDEDRQLFLEGVLAARDRLLIFYTGRHIRTNEPLPPSVVVSELVDTLGGPEPIVHPLQAFSPEVFRESDPARQSHRADLVEGARAIVAVAGEEARPFVDGPLARKADETGSSTVDLDDVRRTLENPARALLKDRLRVVFPSREEGFEEREPFELSGLDGWQLRHLVREQIAEGRSEAEVAATTRATGRLPLGTRGEVALTDAARRMRSFAREVDRDGGGAVEWMPVDVPIGEHRLVGRVPVRRDEGVVFFAKDSSDKAKYRLAAWLYHLAANAHGEACGGGGARFETRIWTYDKEKPPYARMRRLAPVEDAVARLERLIRLHLAARHEVVPFAPEASWAFVESGMREARKKWFPNSRLPGISVSEDPYSARVFDTAPVFAHPGFPDLAHEVIDPVLAALAAGEAGS